MAQVMTTQVFFQQQSKVLRQVFIKSFMLAPKLYDKLFNTYPPDMKRSFFQIMPIVGLGMLALKPEGEVPAFDMADEGVPALWQFATYALAYEITEEANLEDEFNIVGKLPRMLAFAEQITKEVLIWNILNLGFSALAPLSDGQPLFSTTHPLGGDTVAKYGTFSNSLGATALTPESLQQAFILFETMLDDRGMQIWRTPVEAWYSPFMHKIGEEVIGSVGYPYSSENRPNVVHGKVEPNVSRWITSPTAWFINAAKGPIEGDTHSMAVSFKWERRQRTWVDPNTENIRHRTSFRIAIGTAAWNGVVGSQGA